MNGLLKYRLVANALLNMDKVVRSMTGAYAVDNRDAAMSTLVMTNAKYCTHMVPFTCV
jgi:hypothetical protein